MIKHYAAVVAVGVGLALALSGSTPPTPAAAQTPTQPLPPNQLASIVMARGIKSASLFGEGELIPVGPTSTFFNTDVPYAVLKIKNLQANAIVTLRVSGPSGPAFTIEAKIPPRRDGAYPTLDIGLPLYILGTDLETQTGNWKIDVLFNGQPQTTATFQMLTTSPIQLGKIKDLLNQDPLSAELHWRYGAALVLLRHQQEGIDELKNAIKTDQRYALYYITLGRVYEREGRSADAIKMFQTALSLHGSYYDAVYSGWAQAHLARLQPR